MGRFADLDILIRYPPVLPAFGAVIPLWTADALPWCWAYAVLPASYVVSVESTAR